MRNKFGRTLQIVMMMLVCMAGYAQTPCVNNKGDDFNVIAWTYEAMYVTYNINLTTQKDEYVKDALSYYSPNAWSKQYQLLEQQNIFSTIQSKKGILLMGLPVQPVITDKTNNEWKVLVKFDTKILSSSSTDVLQPLKGVLLTVKKTGDCFVIDDFVDA